MERQVTRRPGQTLRGSQWFQQLDVQVEVSALVDSPFARIVTGEGDLR